ncbi:MAG: MFS transporter [Acetobacter orientalis]
MIAVWGLLATYTLLLLCGHSTFMVWVNMVLWGMAASALNMAPQSYAMELAPSEREAACSFSVTGFNAGVGAGALLGGTALSTIGVHSLPIMSSALGFLALIVLYWGKRFTPTKTA